MAGPSAPAPAGTATSVGGLPHRDPLVAARLVLDIHPQLPAAPQLPNLGGGMLAQLAPWLAGVSAASDGSLTVEGRVTVVEPADWCGGPAASAWEGLQAFIAVLGARREPWPPAIKLQLAGPLTLAEALRRAGVAPARALPAAADAVSVAAVTVVEAVRQSLPGSVGVVAALDEPALGLWDTGASPPWPALDAVNVLGATLDAVEIGAALTGAPRGAGSAAGPATAERAWGPPVTVIHCCAAGGWELAVDAGVELLSVPLDAAAPAGPADGPDAAARHRAAAVDALLARGGSMIWGVVPTDGRPLGDAPGGAARLLRAWDRLADAGCDRDRLRRGWLVSPDCGLSGLSEADAGGALRLAADIGRAVTE